MSVFNLNLARECIKWSHDAYNRASISNRATDTQVLTGSLYGSLSPVIAFRGSSSVRDWISDLECELIPFDGAKVHDGFCKAVESVMMDLPRPKPGEAGVVVTGHSLGAALAILAAYRLQAEGVPVAAVYTFGKPRVGNGAFKAKYNAVLGDRTFRVTNQSDVVPWLPFWHWGYRHEGSHIWIAGDGQLFANVVLPYELAENGLEIWRELRLREFAVLADHNRDAYLRLLDPQLEVANV